LLLRTLWTRLLEEDVIELDGSVAVPRTSVADLVPGSVVLDDELHTQLATAPWELREILEATAIYGTAAPPDLVATMLERPPIHVKAVVRSHQDLGLVELRHGEVSFLHPQMATLVVGELDKEERTRLHARVVEARTAVESPNDVALELIDHVLGSGDLISPERRVELLTTAGGRAMRLGAWAWAAAAYEAAADALVDSDPRFDEVVWGAALAHFRNHDRRGCQRYAHARAARARKAGDLVAWGEALELLTRIQLTVGADIVGRRLDDSAIVDFLHQAGEREPKLRARLTGTMAELHFAAFDFDAGLASSESARRIAADVGDDELTAVTAFTEGIQRLGRLQLREAEACFLTSIDHAERLPDPWLRTWGRGRLPLVLWAQGRLREAWTAVDRALSAAEANHDWAELSIVHAAATGLAAVEGRLDVAERHAADAIRTFDRSEYAYTPGVVYPSLAMARALRADRAGARTAVADWRAQGAVGLAGAFDVFIAAAAGDVEATRKLLQAHPWRGRAGQPVDLGRVAFAAGYIDVAALLDEPALATAVIPVLQAAHRQGVRYVIAGGAGSVCRLLATGHRLIGDHAAVRELLADAEHQLVGAPSRLGHAELSYERSLLAAVEGDAATASTQAADAAAGFDEIGALAGLARAEAVLRRVSRRSVQPARRTRVILCTDLVDSTALNAAVGDDDYLELLHEHDRTIRDLVRRYDGVPFSHTGDGMLAWFDRGDDAAACAIAFQPALDDVNRAHPDRLLRVRCGLAAGEPIADSGNIFGLAVVRAARVAAIAGAGEVLASAEVTALATGTAARPHGAVALKGLPEPVSVYSLRDPMGERAAL
jgi:class 3 adenylate cyclase